MEWTSTSIPSSPSLPTKSCLCGIAETLQRGCTIPPPESWQWWTSVSGLQYKQGMLLMSLLPIQSNNKLYNYIAASSVVSQEVAWSGKGELKNPTQENEFPVPAQMERDYKIWVVVCLQWVLSGEILDRQPDLCLPNHSCWLTLKVCNFRSHGVLSKSLLW